MSRFDRDNFSTSYLDGNRAFHEEEFFEEKTERARSRERDRSTRCRWEETALTLERGSVRTEARARSFAYLLPPAPLSLSPPFNLSPCCGSHDRCTKDPQLERVKIKERKKERKEGIVCGLHFRKKGSRGSRSYSTGRISRDSPRGEEEEERRGEDAFSAAARNLRPMETPYLVLDHGSRTRAPLSRR